MRAPEAHGGFQMHLAKRALTRSTPTPAGGSTHKDFNNKNRAIEETALSKSFAGCQLYLSKLEQADNYKVQIIYDMLAEVLQFYLLSEKSDMGRNEYRQILLRHKIKITNNTKNPFTPILKAIFGGTERSNLSRWAGVLYAAYKSKIEPKMIKKFVEDAGGIVKAYEKGADLLNPKREKKAELRQAEMLKEFIKSAQRVNPKLFKNEIPEGLCTFLAFKNETGELFILSHRKESNKSIVNKYKVK